MQIDRKAELHKKIGDDFTDTYRVLLRTVPSMVEGLLDGDSKIIESWISDRLINDVDAFEMVASASRLWGGVITSNGDGTVHITAGEGMVKTTSAGPEDIPTAVNEGQAGNVIRVTWEEVAALSLVNNAYNYIFYQKSTNSIVTTTDFYSINFTQDFTIGRGYRTDNTVVVRLCGTNAWNFNRRVQLYGEEVSRIDVKQGSLVIGNPSGRYISHNGGVLWAELVNRFTIDSFDTTQPFNKFTYWYRDGIGGFTGLIDYAQIENGVYDNGTGSLAPLSNNRYGVHWVYVVHDGSVHVIYGRGDYKLNEAEEATPPGSLPGLVDSYATLIGKIIIAKGASVFTSLESPFTKIFNSTGTALHDELGNRDLADQHPISAITGLTTALAGKALAAHTHLEEDLTIDKYSQSEVDNLLNFKADLVGGVVPSAQLPGYVDDVLPYANAAAFPTTGESGKIYLDEDENKSYRWTGVTYAVIGSDLALGETSATAYRGDRGKLAYDHSLVLGSNPHNVPFSAIASKPTTVSGYGITDALLEDSAAEITGLFTFKEKIVLSNTSELNAAPSEDLEFKSVYSAGGGYHTKSLKMDGDGNLIFDAYQLNHLHPYASETHTHDSAYAQLSHHHDDRYFTETEADARFAALIHSHDDRYFTETESDARFARVVHTHAASDIVEDTANRFVSDVQISSWNAKPETLIALGYTGDTNAQAHIAPTFAEIQARLDDTDVVVTFGVSSNKIVLNTANAGSPQIGFSDTGDCSWAVGADDADNSFKIHGVAGATIPTINGLAVPLLEITTSGTIIANGTELVKTNDSRLVSHSDVVVDGDVTEANTASKIVKRSSSGDVVCRLLRMEYTSTNSTPNYFLTQNAVGSGADNYSRPSTLAQVKSALGEMTPPVASATVRGGMKISESGGHVTITLS